MRRHRLQRRYGRATSGRHAWRVLYQHKDHGYVVASSRFEALREALLSAPHHWEARYVSVQPDLRHPNVRARHA